MSLTPLYFGLAVSFGGDQKSLGAIPGIQLALDQINNNASLLEGYVLRYTLTDSQVCMLILYTVTRHTRITLIDVYYVSDNYVNLHGTYP